MWAHVWSLSAKSLSDFLLYVSIRTRRTIKAVQINFMNSHSVFLRCGDRLVKDLGLAYGRRDLLGQ